MKKRSRAKSSKRTARAAASKGDDISNKALASIMLVAVAIFVLGVFVNINNGGLGALTGRAVDNESGVATLTVLQAVELTNQIPTINWGSGFVNGSGGFNNCTLDSNGTVSAGCASFNTVTDGFLLENTGNANLSVNYSVDVNATGFLNGTNPSFQIVVTPNSVAQQNNESSALDTVASCGNSWTHSTYTEVNTTGAFLCGDGSTTFPLAFAGDRDAAVVDVRVRLPEDAPTGAKTATFTFRGISS